MAFKSLKNHITNLATPFLSNAISNMMKPSSAMDAGKVAAKLLNKSPFEIDENLGEIEKKIVKILDQKIRPAVAKDGGDIKFKEFKDGVVKVQLQGSCSGCPSSTMTLKQGVQNLLCHYLPEVKEVVAI